MTAATGASLEQRIKAQAYGIGFDLVGIAALGPADTAAAFEGWLDKGYAGDMEYLRRSVGKRRDSRLPFPGATHAVVVALDYGGREPSGPVARYARGDDYHEIMVDRLRELHRFIDDVVGRPVRGKAYVDTGPILERDLARRAGLGWLGKNTMLLNPRLGSFFFLGELLLELELEADAPFESDHCGRCTRCLEACPTQALVAPGELDATRCISYLTIEAKGEMPRELRPLVGELLYGCDICQEVCPYNRKFSHEVREPAFAPREALFERDARALALALLGMSQAEFSAAFSGSPMKRARLRGHKRNAAVLLGGAASERDVPALAAALADPEPLVRAHVAWALGRIGSAAALGALRDRLPFEHDLDVAEELRAAIASVVS